MSYIFRCFSIKGNSNGFVIISSRVAIERIKMLLRIEFFIVNFINSLIFIQNNQDNCFLKKIFAHFFATITLK